MKTVKFFQLPIDIAGFFEQKTHNFLADYYLSITQYRQGIYCVHKYK